ncbi:hypothetical protein EC988_003964, partial [Linderina pennispora]
LEQASHVYGRLSSFCGSLARAKPSALQALIGHLVSADRLVRLYTDDVHLAPLGNGSELDLRTVFVRGSATKFVCKACTAKNALTQAVLFKAMGCKDVKCEVCGQHGPMARWSGDAQAAFVPDICGGSENLQVAMGLADVDAKARVDLAVVVGAADAEPSSGWSSVLDKVSESAGHTIVVTESGRLPDYVAAGPAVLAAKCSIESFGQRWEAHQTMTEQSSQESTSSVAEKAGALQALDASSTAGSSDERSHSQGSGTPRSGKRHGKGRNKGEKVNLNHLLNFSLPVRMPSPLPAPRARKHRDSAPSARQSQLTKRTFINANFRFVLRPEKWSQFTQVADKPDVHVKWEWIERVVMPVQGDSVQCPICLSPPVAARVTKCGHVFCFPCVLRYLAMETEKPDGEKKCPICWEPVAGTDDLLPVHLWNARYQPAASSSSSKPAHSASSCLPEGMHITMRLMKRLRGSTICLPRPTASMLFAKGLAPHVVTEKSDPLDPHTNDTQRLTFDSFHFPWTFTQHAMPFAKFLLAGHTYCRDEYARELRELSEESKLTGNDPMAQMFIESAVALVELAIGQTEKQSSEKLEESVLKAQTTDQSDEKTADHTDDFRYFYQADDGQHIYMHPLYMRVLSEEHNGYTDLPDTLDIKLRHAVESTITGEVRQRFKILDHLPLRCDVIFIEPEIKHLVSARSLDKFRAQIAHREKQHAARARHLAIDEARSAAMAAAAEQAGSAIQYRSEWTREGHNRYGELQTYSGSKPDAASFPALSGSATPAKGSAVESPKTPRDLWPRQPASTGAGELYNELWEEFERNASHYDDYDEHDEHDEPDHDYDDKYFHLSERAGADARPAHFKLPETRSKKIKNKAKAKIVLSGSSGMRRR